MTISHKIYFKVSIVLNLNFWIINHRLNDDKHSIPTIGMQPYLVTIGYQRFLLISFLREARRDQEYCYKQNYIESFSFLS